MDQLGIAEQLEAFCGIVLKLHAVLPELRLIKIVDAEAFRCAQLGKRKLLGGRIADLALHRKRRFGDHQRSGQRLWRRGRPERVRGHIIIIDPGAAVVLEIAPRHGLQLIEEVEHSRVRQKPLRVEADCLRQIDLRNEGQRTAFPDALIVGALEIRPLEARWEVGNAADLGGALRGDAAFTHKRYGVLFAG